MTGHSLKVPYPGVELPRQTPTGTPVGPNPPLTLKGIWADLSRGCKPKSLRRLRLSVVDVPPGE